MFIRTSKTRAVISRRDPGKVNRERLTRMQEKHLVFDVNAPMNLETVEKVLDSGGTRTRDLMQEKRAKNAEKAHKRYRERAKEAASNSETYHRKRMVAKKK